MLFIRGYYFLFGAFIFALSKLGDAFSQIRQPQQQRQDGEGLKKIVVSTLSIQEKKNDVAPALVN